MNCTTTGEGVPSIPCTEIPPETELVCSCPECVRELLFTYNGSPCEPNLAANGRCVDSLAAPFVGDITCTNTDAPTEVVVSGQFQLGETIVMTPAAGQTCIPDSLSCTISTPEGATAQTVEIDASCDGGRQLTLLENYGFFTSVGYSCDAMDRHNCLVDIVYDLEVCNRGSEEETIYFWDFILNDTVVEDLLANIPAEDTTLMTDECLSAVVTEFVNRCQDEDYCAESTANATNPTTGVPSPCDDEEEIKFSWAVEPPPPTPMPSPEPSPAPTPAPSPMPTGTCDILVEIDGCFNFTPVGDNNCEGRPVQISFRYNGGDCSQSDNLQDRQKFDCFDIEPPIGAGPPPTQAGVESYIVATQLGGGSVYFEGLVEVGKIFTLNEDLEFDKLAADMNVTVYDPTGPEPIVQGANIMQTQFIHLSCSQPLFLKDRFGSAQVVQWIEDDGRNVSCFQETVTGDLVVALDAENQEQPVRLLEMTIISNLDDEPINKTEEVFGQILEPGGEIVLEPLSIQVDLTERVRYTFFTTIIGETLDGSQMCNGFDFYECIAGVALPPFFPTLAPTPSPTITPYPTPDPETTTCEIRSVIECLVTRPFVEGGCDFLKAPTALTCTPGAELEELFLQYTGMNCQGDPWCTDSNGGPSGAGEVYIDVTDCEKAGFFQGTVSLDDTIRINSRGNFLCPEITVTIQEVDFDEETESNNGATIQTLVLPTTCPFWTLNEDYGALQLTQYTSDIDGIQTTSAEIFMNFAVDNLGAFGATVEMGNIESPFGSGPPPGLPLDLPRRTRASLLEQTATIDLIGEGGRSFDFSLQLDAVANTQFGLPCDDFANYTFTL